MENKNQKIPKRILSSLIASVSAGVVPRSGAPYIAIGRQDEIKALLSDLELMNEGGGSMRFLVGRYGSGKSFLMQLIRGYALERDFLTADCDLSPERRLYGSGGAGVATYRELMKNLASKAAPDGGAMPKIIAKWVFTLQGELIAEGITPDSPQFSSKLDAKLFESLREIEFLVGGFDFSRVIGEYYRATLRSDDLRAAACLRWLRGEFSTKTEARKELGFDVSVIIGDNNWYDFLKLWASLSRAMGYRGLLVFIDECVNLYKIPHRVSRENNYEKILSMFNDTLQGRAPYLGLVLGGTPQFLEDPRRGLFSYEALRSRLCDSRFSSEKHKNFVGPVIRLTRLSDDELLALVVRMTALHGQNFSWDPRITTEEQVRFVQICLDRAGANMMITPREMLRDYMTLLNILMQNPSVDFNAIVGTAVTLKTEAEEDAPVKTDDAPRSKFDPEDIDF